MFSYYGSKSKIVHLYPRPKHDLIIEPFAGSARYALRYFDRDVVLVDKYKVIIDVWHYLQNASEKDVLGLPRIAPGTNLNTLSLSHGERMFLAFICSHGISIPQYQIGKFNSIERDLISVSKQLFKIRHWRLVHGTKESIANVEATWFIDPPYFNGGHKYKHGNKGLDFDELSEWARSRNGQAIVCENDAATWMPFRPLKRMSGAYQTTNEVWWTNDDEPTQQNFFT